MALQKPAPTQRVPETRQPCGVIITPGCACNAYAQITARCSAEHNHAFALYMNLRGDRVGGACYSEGSGKIQNDRSSREVEAAVRFFCGYLSGRPLEEIAQARLPDLVAHGGQDPTVLEQAGDLSPTASEEELHEVRERVGAGPFSLLVGGAIPFVLFNWALLNHQVKQAVQRVLGTRPGEVVRFRGVDDVYALVDELRQNPILASWGRSLELGVRAMDLNTVDESSMRSAYQRGTYLHFLKEAEKRGFRANFRVV